METITLTRSICLPSRHLDQNIQDHLLQILTEKVTNECNKKVGHIISIIGINRILNHKIERVNLNNIFTLEFQATTLNPKVGAEVLGTVCMLYKDGIFLNIKSIQKMLIPATSINSYEYNDSTKSYDSSESSIQMGDIVKAIITASQYNNHSFSCLGILKELQSP